MKEVWYMGVQYLEQSWADAWNSWIRLVLVLQSEYYGHSGRISGQMSMAFAVDFIN